jgi:hypothetical protein
LTIDLAAAIAGPEIHSNPNWERYVPELLSCLARPIVGHLCAACKVGGAPLTTVFANAVIDLIIKQNLEGVSAI